MRSFSERIIGAAKFDTQVYEEVEFDTSATGQAMGVVLLSSLAAGVGSVGLGFGGVLIACLASLIAWVVWAAITYFIGTKLLPEAHTRADIGQLMRTLGFAQAPGLIKVAGVFPGVGPLVVGIVSIWMLATMIVAVRQALDYKSTLRAVGVVSVGWLFYVIVFMSFALMSMNS